MDQQTLAARTRVTTGKGAARRLRQKNQVPAVFYGPKTETIMLAVNYPEMERVIEHQAGGNIMLDLQIQTDQGTETRKAMLKELVIDPVKDTYLHADFYEISMDKEITVDVPISLINTPIGASQGGILQQVKRELTITCLPGSLVNAFEIDVADLDIGDSLQIKDIELPEGLTTPEEGNITVVLVAAPTVQEEETEEEEIEAEEEGEAAESEEKSAEEE